MQELEPRKEHDWLKQLIGDWTYEAEAQMGPDITKVEGTETFLAIGDIWVQGNGIGEMPDGNVGRSQMTLGYDPQRKRFIGTWLGTMMFHMWVYEGWLDESEKVLTLQAEGPDFANPGKYKTYRDVIEIINDDERTLSSQAQDENGEWKQFMIARYWRR